MGRDLRDRIGVQKSETRERDFQHGRARDFILVGLLLTALFIFLLWAVVRLVMYLAGESIARHPADLPRWGAVARAVTGS